MKILHKFLALTTVFSMILCGCAVKQPEQNKLGISEDERTVLSSDIQLVLNYALQMVDENDPKQEGEFTWDTERKKRSWTYYTGCMTDAFMKIYESDKENNEKYYTWVRDFYDNLIETNGINLGKQYIKGEVDSIACGKALMKLPDGDYSKTLDFIYSETKKQTSYPQYGGNFLHKMNKDSWAVWNIALDGLYMAGTFLTDYADVLELRGNTEKADKIRKECFERTHWMAQNMQMENGLYTHAFSAKDQSINNVAWLRSDGWYIMALVDAIDAFPEGEERDNLIADFNKFYDGMVQYVDKSGMWYNLPDETSETLPGNFLETSGTAMISYAILHAYNQGYATKEQFETGKKAFVGICENKIKIEANGRISINDIYMKSGVDTNKAYYLTQEILPDEAKGTAFVIMAAVELMEALK